MKTRSIISLILSIILLISALIACNSCKAGPNETANASEGLEFELNEDGKTYYVKGIGTCTDASVVIPNKYNGKPVTSIGDSAFESCTSITSVTIPSSVTEISLMAFSGCTSLENISVSPKNKKYHSDGNCLIETETKKLVVGCKNSVIPTDGSVTAIGNAAFCICTGLTSITIPDSVNEIGVMAFTGCTSLKNISVSPNNKKYHSDGNCVIETKTKILVTGCKTSVIPTDGSVTEIGNAAFYGCSGLTIITIPDSVTKIGMYAFYYCKNLTSITIPDSVTKICMYAFDDCINLETVNYTGTGGQWDQIVIDKYNNPLHEATKVYNSSNIQLQPTAASEGLAFKLNEGGDAYYVAGIGKCTDASVVIPAAYEGKPVTEIGIVAFYDCTSLTSITIPDSVIKIGYLAFSNCASLENISVSPKNKKYHSDGNCVIETETKTLAVGCKTSVIPTDGSVTEIGNGAFYGSESLTSITIPDSVTKIGMYAFYNCTSLETVNYTGTSEQWDQINIVSLGNDPLYKAAKVYNYVEK